MLGCSGWAASGSDQICYVQTGDGPDVILIPGLGASRHSWWAVVQSLAASFRLTALDPRAHHESSGPEEPFTVGDMASDALAVMDSADVTRAVVVGSSMSGAVALNLAALHPDRVSGVVSVGGFHQLPPAGAARMRERAAIAREQGMTPLVDMVAAGALSPHTHALQPALVGFFRQMLHGMRSEGYARAAEAVADTNVAGLLSDVKCPVLLLNGAEERVAPIQTTSALL